MLTQEQADKNCETAEERYMALPMRDASLAFAYEAQGYVGSCVERGKTVDEAIIHVIELLVAIKEAQAERKT